jgi:hypothetical protein
LRGADDQIMLRCCHKRLPKVIPTPNSTKGLYPNSLLNSNRNLFSLGERSDYD